MRRINRALRTLSSCNQAVIHATDEIPLLGEICRVTVEDGGYVMAWVGYAEHDARRTVRPVARAGREAGYLDTADITWADEPRGRGPTGTAIRTGRPAVCRDMRTDPLFAPWREEALRRGYNASIVLPLIQGTEVLGAISIYAAEASSFDPQEVKLLEELAGDLTYGIEALRTRRAHQEAAARLAQALAYNRSLLESAIDPLLVIAPDGRITDVNAATERATGRSRAELVGADFAEHFTEPERARAGCQEVFREGALRDATLELRARAGHVTAVVINASVYRDERGAVLGAFAAARDVTERQRAERKMREALLEAQRFREALDRVSAYVYIKDADSRYVYANQPMLDLFRCTADELPSIGDASFFPSETARRLREVDLQVLAGESSAGEVAIQTSDGADRVYWEVRTPLQLEIGGRMRPGLLGISTDITALKRAEADVRRRERELEAAQRIAHVGSWRLEVASGATVWSEELYHMFGLDPRQPAPTYSEQPRFFQAESWRRLDAALSRARATGEPYELELEMVRLDGSTGWMFARGEGEADGSGCIVALHGVAQDITARRMAEAALRQEQALFSSLVSTIPDRIYFKDRQSRFVLINDKMAQISGFPEPAAAVGMTDFDVFSEEHARQAFADEQRIMETGEPMVDYEERETWPDGRVGWVTSTKFPLRDAQGGITGLVGISRDITARKNLEARFLQAQKMEAFGQLAGGVAHDFNNILSVMLMQVNLLQMEQVLPGRVISGLAELERCAMRGAGLTRQLLMFARRQEMEPRQLDLVHVVDEATKMLRRVLGEHIAFEFVRPAGEAWIEADPGMIEQVLMNLCINARDAMRNGGRLTVTIRPERRMAPGGDVPAKVTCLSVADTGVGMDEATKARIFEPFFTTKPAGVGTGLGLATVYGIMQQHRGWVEVDSVPEKGSVFRVYFPRGAGARPASSADPGLRRTPRGTEAVLLVEDEESLRSSLAITLRAAGYRVVEAANGPEALQRWEASGGEFALLLTDYLMPGGMNGAQLATRLREARPPLRAIIMSGYVPGHRESRTPWPERTGRLPKPFEAAKLLTVIRECLDDGPAA